MVRTIQLTTNAQAADVIAALARFPRAAVALVLPLGEPCALGEARELAVLSEFCAAHDKQVVIVGADASTRALAVAAGFAAATSLEEWDTAKQRALGVSRKAARRPRVTAGPKREPLKDLRVVPSTAISGDPNAEDDLYGAGGDDPPGYIADLVANVPDESHAHYATVPTIPLERARRTRPLNATELDQREAAALERSQQVFEEQLTATIRQSGGVEAAPEAAAQSDDPSADGGAPETD